MKIKRKKFYIVAGIAVLCAALIYWLLPIFLRVYVMKSTVMEPLVPTGAIVIMKRIHNIDELKRGDIVHWNFPSYTSIPSNTSTLGIVVGFPNEHLELKHGDIWINDQIAHIRPFQYVYTKSEPNVLEGYKMKQKYMNMIIPKNTYYILCLDRNAMDSREVGTIPWTNIKSKVIEHINP